jgi:hypothetical protein
LLTIFPLNVRPEIGSVGAGQEFGISRSIANDELGGNDRQRRSPISGHDVTGRGVSRGGGTPLGDLMRSSITYAVAAFLSVSSAAKADGIGGGSFVPVEDGFRHECIDVSTKYVSMQVITLQAKRTNSWWKSSKSLGGKFDVTLTNADGKPFVFPRGTTLSAKNITGDVALLPVKFSLMSRYDLAPQQKPFVSVGLGFYVVNLENKSGVIQGIQSFIDFSKTLPLPPNPYIQGLQFFGDFANKVMDENIQTQEEKDPVALFSYDLAQNADDVKNCPSVALRSGINAVLFELNGKVSDGVIPINDVNSYCYWYEAGRLTFRAKSADGSCAKIGPSKPILNPAVAFVVHHPWRSRLRTRHRCSESRCRSSGLTR